MQNTDIHLHRHYIVTEILSLIDLSIIEPVYS